MKQVQSLLDRLAMVPPARSARKSSREEEGGSLATGSAPPLSFALRFGLLTLRLGFTRYGGRTWADSEATIGGPSGPACLEPGA